MAWHILQYFGGKLVNSNGVDKRFRPSIKGDGVELTDVTAHNFGVVGPSDGTLSTVYLPASYSLTVTNANSGGASSNAVYDAITVDPNVSGPATSTVARLEVRTNHGAQRVRRRDTLANLTAAGVKFFV